MDLKRLEMFRTVAQRGNLRLAAQQLGRTIPAISIQIKNLEEELGVQLFHHTRSKLLLNEQGRIFLAELENVFSSLERAKRLAVGGPHQTTASLSISLGGDLSIFFAARIAAFARAYPEVSISIVSGPTSRSLALVGNRECDIGIGFYRTAPRGLRRFAITETGYHARRSARFSIAQGRAADARPDCRETSHHAIESFRDSPHDRWSFCDAELRAELHYRGAELSIGDRICGTRLGSWPGAWHLRLRREPPWRAADQHGRQFRTDGGEPRHAPRCSRAADP